MRTVKYFLLATLAMTMVGLGMFQAREADQPKYTIKEVMKLAHKSNLWKKVAEGKASKEEKDKLVELYTALSEDKPPKGDAKDWKERTDAMVKAAKEAAAGEKQGEKALLKAVKCLDCHKLHKGD